MKPVIQLDPPEAGCFLIGENVYVRGCNKTVKAFLGIPYAQPPVGDLRFRPAEKLQLWLGFREANRYGAACPQNRERVSEIYGQLPNLPTVYDEDCLYLNIWTPNTSSDSHLPVMVWIHGGAFVQGFSNIYDGTSLAAYEKVVIVSINYRVGVFGFLRTGANKHDYHGNQGFLDQLEALKWVQRYIHCFGGDPSNVTVFGESAGAISISYHLTSPMAEGLFQKAILQSGSSLAPNSVWPIAGVEKYWWKRIHSMGFQGYDCESLISFLNATSTEELVSVFNDWFVPCAVDGNYMIGQPQCLYQARNFHPVDCIFGFNSSEGVGFVPKHVNSMAEAEVIIEKLVSKNFFRGKPQTALDIIAALAKTKYLTGNNHVCDVSDFYGDVNFVAPCLQQAKYHSGKAKTYIYQFDHRPLFSNKPPWVRGNHGDEIAYVFGYPFLLSIPDIWHENDKQLSKHLMKYWANFARTGNPNGTDDNQVLWHHFNQESPYYLKIQNTTIESHGIDNLLTDKILLWNNFVPKVLKQSNHPSKY